VQDNLVPLLNKQFGCHEAEARGRTGNEYACHVNSPVLDGEPAT
jgi:hypothetical protein